MTNDELDRLEGLANAATPGPWEVAGRGIGYWAVICEYPHTPAVDGCAKRENAAFIAAARDGVPAMAKALRERDVEIARLRALVRNAYVEGHVERSFGPAEPSEDWETSEAKRLLEGGFTVAGIPVVPDPSIPEGEVRLVHIKDTVTMAQYEEAKRLGIIP